MQLPPDLRAQIVAHAVRDAPAECCGVIAVADGAGVAVHELENLAHSPLRFEVDGLALHHLLTEIEDAGLALGAIYHSHTRSAPYPSQTDINFAAGWPGVEWVIVGTAGEEPELRSYLIDGAQITEVPVT
ncbi:MAG: hypothetical protein AVDCRST_MAG13-3765 [uncultured Solirubrobacteraceae bacterium]|uniref:JAB domain-containing protein n=1 Tax=uncultured Solirubrobacteraceae bacterium TaxID=1162706 RepID=A0A6J4TMB4_9ACTN|nr:MAG: hypothetical protein AVDCRST_MAG13-3765 [uncultured Solirubrobacteraceae bacterium]